jgi:CheY-like chemotaxis protein
LANEPSAASFRKLLLVEDDFMIARALGRVVRLLGAEVVGPAATIAHATELAGTAEFDCALLDIDLRGVKAYTVADILTRRGMPFAFLTGYSQIDIPKDYKHVPLLEKPVSLHALRALWNWGP